MGRVRKLKEKWQLGSKIRQAIPKVNVSSNTAKIMMSVLLSVCCVGVSSGATHAANAIGTLGVCNIGNPTYKSSGSTYNYVYFGNIPDDTENYYENAVGKPIYWRVLNTRANDDYGTPALFMLTEYGISQKAWDENNNDSSDSYRTCGQIWDDYYATVEGYNEAYGVDRASTVRGFLQGITSGKKSGASYAIKDYNGNGMYQNCFSSKEQKAIMITEKIGETMEAYNDSCNPSSLINPSNSTNRKWYTSNSGYSFYAYGCPLRGDTIFLLSAEEASNSSYGFEEPTSTGTKPAADKNRICKQGASGGSSSWWWLRSGFSDFCYYVANVFTDGSGSSNGSAASSVAVRCALNLNLASVILTSPASGATATASLSSFTAIPASAPSAVAICAQSPAPTTTAEAEAIEIAAASKLTILDETRNNFQIVEPSVTAYPNQTITLSYINAKIGTDENICGIIKSLTGGTNYQATLIEDVARAGGGVTMTIPQGLPTGTYTLMLYNETDNGSCQTNYARYDTVELTVVAQPELGEVDTTSPTVTNVYKNSNGTYYKLTANDDTYLNKVTDASGAINLRGLSVYGSRGTANVEIPEGTIALRVYDASNNYCDVNSINNEILVDSTSPIIESITYENGQCIITVTDNESGIWKIQGSSGRQFADYST